MIDLKDYIKQINEAQIYDGGEDLCRYICKVIKDNPSEDFIVINTKNLKFNNIFFKHLLLYINDNITEKFIEASYSFQNDKNKEKIKANIGDLFKWNNEEKVFNYIEISIWTTSKKDRDIQWGDITHEINHAWDDYQEKLKDPSRNLMSSIDIERYNIAKNLVKYPIDTYDKVIGVIEYTSTDIESKSFSVQAMAKFKDNLDKYSNFKDALEWQFKNNEIFAGYFSLITFFNKEKQNKDFIYKICKRYRKRFIKDDNLSNNEIVDMLSTKLQKYYEVLIEDINKLLDDYAKKNAL